MSRIGNKPVAIPSGVKVSVNDGVVTVEGPKDKLTQQIPPLVSLDITESQVVFNRADDSRKSSAMQGLIRSLVNNMIIGVTQGYKKELQIVGVGYRAALKGKVLDLSLGFSHPVEFQIPEGITISVPEPTKIIIEGADKQSVGEVAATIRRYRKPEPYKGKGIRYAGEQVSLKEGKSVG
jgi:large subunit ribosomal protein L6